jgi:hypothetical protein
MRILVGASISLYGVLDTGKYLLYLLEQWKHYICFYDGMKIRTTIR